MDSVHVCMLHGAKDLRIETRPLTDPQADELQIAIRSTGLCGSDLHYYNHGRNGDIVMREPLCMGHESAGVVTALGSSVTNFSIGDRVALEVGIPCGKCDRCGEGRYNICKEVRFRSSAKSFPHFQGTLQERLNQPAEWCYKLPDSMSLDLGALLEPFSVAVHAERRAQLPANGTVLVFGAGTIGLLTAARVKVAGAREVIIADIAKCRVDFAVKNGFAHSGFTVPMKRGNGIDEELEIAKELAKSIGEVQRRDGGIIGEMDAVFECTGVPSCVQAAIYATRPGGKVMLIGMGTSIYTLPIAVAAHREVDICGVFRYANTYAEGISVLSKEDPEGPQWSKLVTHTFQGIENAEDAFKMAGRTEDDEGNRVLKVVVGMGEDE